MNNLLCLLEYYMLFYKHLYKQRRAETDKKSSKS